jgi:hypothetical protein
MLHNHGHANSVPHDGSAAFICILPTPRFPPLYSTACLAGAASGKEFIVQRECKRAVAFLLAVLLLPVLAARGADAIPPERSPFQVELLPDGTFSLLFHRVPLVTSAFKFWAANWKWANPTAAVGPFRDGVAPFAVQIPNLAAEASGTIALHSPEVLTYDLTVRHGATQPDVLGGGLEFVLDMKSPYFQDQKPPDSVLLPDNTGWSWPLGPDREVKVVFSPAIRKVYFENNNKGRIRAFFVGASDSAGTDKFTVTITLPKGTERKPTEEEEYGPLSGSWLPNVLSYSQSPVDLSTLNHQPGAHGFLRTSGDRLVFEDGTPARFWGIDVMAYALFSSNTQIERHARRLAMLGFNLVRLHHHDTTGWVVPTVIDMHLKNSRMLDRNGIDRVDYWIKCLHDNGIYVWLDMHSYRQFRDGDRQTELGTIATYKEFSDKRFGYQVKGFCQYDPVVQKLMVEFQEKYLNHVNRYTNVAYKDDPTIAFALITNENDITHHYGILALPREKHPQLTELWQARLKQFAAKTGLNENEMRMPWSPGPASMFLNDQEHAFYETMTQSIRGTGCRALIANGNVWGDNPQSCIPSLTSGDVIDVHAYDGPDQLLADPRYKPNIVSMIGINQVADKPLTVSEWNMEASLDPPVDRFIAPIYVASIAALQGWDALMLYGYCQQALSDQARVTSVWDTYADPAIMASMPAAALLFRNGHVAQAKKDYCLALSRDQMFGPSIRPESCRAARTLMEQSRFTLGIPSVPELDWLKPTKLAASVNVIHDPEQSFLSNDARAVTSDTGQIRRDWDAGVQTIDTPKSQIVQGAIGDHEYKLSDVTVLVNARHASVAVSALDEQPLRTSNLILITTVARVVKPKRLQGRAAWNQDFSIFSEPVRGEVTIQAPPGLEALHLLTDGRTIPIADTLYQDGRYRIPMQKKLGAWYLLQKK